MPKMWKYSVLIQEHFIWVKIDSIMLWILIYFYWVTKFNRYGNILKKHRNVWSVNSEPLYFVPWMEKNNSFQHERHDTKRDYKAKGVHCFFKETNWTGNNVSINPWYYSLKSDYLKAYFFL